MVKLYILKYTFVLKQVVAFVLEAFFAEMEMHSTAKESEVASDGDSSDDEV